MMLQPDGQVGWDPIIVEHQPPLMAKLLILYLLAVSLWTLAKMTLVLRQSFRAPVAQTLDVCLAKLQVVRRWIALTVLLTFAICSGIAATSSRVISSERSTATGLIFGVFSEVFAIFSLAMFTSATLYALAMACEARVQKQRLRETGEKPGTSMISKSQAETEVSLHFAEQDPEAAIQLLS